ncbi:MAG TPA: bifunctional phosphopantothenoylcysteine decarboxylase/phosphopantothenate--cysteine ligase CoaBC [Thermomicrobiales bacterium]|nr:bifunctional phosphopantothenoylcysteine decarboxylase/phosphopantothenate--cysteine ligase CoaBC [Thermomicrobiales bacterium]
MNPLTGARIILGVSGGIAAYKAADLASKLVQAGAVVDVVLTRGAAAFIRPLTFQALTKRPVHDDVFEAWTEHSSGHVSLAAEADLLIVAPASANTIARLALGLADDFLGLLSLSTRAPLLLAPAMEHNMYLHAATRENIATLRDRGAAVVGPERGHLASGAEGEGRLSPVTTIIGAARQLLGRAGSLAGRYVVVTAGGTQEPLDPVRYLGNRSSGTMGFALAQAALDRGAAVTLVSGPTRLQSPVGARFVSVQTAAEMQNAVLSATESADVLIMAAAVSDFRPATSSHQKLKKSSLSDGPTVQLVENPDIVGSLIRPGLLKIGFAAETDDLLIHAAAKLHAKGLALIVANDAVATIGRDDSQAVLIEADRPPTVLPLLHKPDLASRIVDRIGELLQEVRE